MTYLHIGCGRKIYQGMVNLTEKEMDISKPWPYQDATIDAIVSMQVLQQLYWRDLIKALHEAYRVLKPGGVFRAGTMLIDDNKAEYALGWDNINLFSLDLLKRVLEQVGFKEIRLAKYQDSIIEEFKVVDDRPIGLGTSYCECIK